jgi:imidazoleglycerol-phosphate dehydratase
MRKTTVSRNTKETEITVTLDIDGKGNVVCDSGNGFFDHMINAFGKHAGFDIELHCKGDTEVDFHHSAEDIGIVLGQAFAKCTEDKTGIRRFGTAETPLDEALVRVTSDLSGRPFIVFNADFETERTGDFETQLVEEFFRAFAMNSLITLHINKIYGKNSHHVIEAMFKSAGRSLAQSVEIVGDVLLSTKGVL